MQNSTTANLPDLITLLHKDFPELSFEAAKRFSWHAAHNRITYQEGAPQTQASQWALLHEVGHALLGHTDYRSDFELLKIEVAAWEEARKTATNYGIEIDDDYIQDCLDSYRDWLHIRSTCPTCYERCLQSDKHTYRCHNCATEWHVSRSRLCRPYRRKTP